MNEGQYCWSGFGWIPDFLPDPDQSNGQVLKMVESVYHYFRHMDAVKYSKSELAKRIG